MAEWPPPGLVPLPKQQAETAAEAWPPPGLEPLPRDAAPAGPGLLDRVGQVASDVGSAIAHAPTAVMDAVRDVGPRALESFATQAAAATPATIGSVLRSPDVARRGMRGVGDWVASHVAPEPGPLHDAVQGYASGSWLPGAVLYDNAIKPGLKWLEDAALKPAEEYWQGTDAGQRFAAAQAQPGLEPLSNPDYIAGMAGQLVPAMGMMMAAPEAAALGAGTAQGARLVAPLLGAAMEGGMALQQTERGEQASGQPVGDIRAATAALVTGAVNGLLKDFGMQAVLGRVQGLFPNLSPIRGLAVVQRALQGALYEAAAGGGQQFMRNAPRKALVDPETHLLEGMRDQIVGGALSGGLMSAVHAGAQEHQPTPEELSRLLARELGLDDTALTPEEAFQAPQQAQPPAAPVEPPRPPEAAPAAPPAEAPRPPAPAPEAARPGPVAIPAEIPPVPVAPEAAPGVPPAAPPAQAAPPARPEAPPRPEPAPQPEAQPQAPPRQEAPAAPAAPRLGERVQVQLAGTWVDGVYRGVGKDGRQLVEAQLGGKPRRYPVQPDAIRRPETPPTTPLPFPETQGPWPEAPERPAAREAPPEPPRGIEMAPREAISKPEGETPKPPEAAAPRLEEAPAPRQAPEAPPAPRPEPQQAPQPQAPRAESPAPKPRATGVDYPHEFAPVPASEDVPFSAGPERRRAQVAPEELRGLADRWNALKREGLPVEVVSAQSDLPRHILERVSRGEVVDGVRDERTGRIFLVEENLTSRDHAIETIVHESVGHDGFRVLAGDRPAYDRFLEAVYAGNRQAIDSAPWLEHYGFDTSTPEGRRKATDEWAAREAGRILREEVGREDAARARRPEWVNRFVDFVHRGLARIRVQLGLRETPRETVERMIRDGRLSREGLGEAARAARENLRGDLPERSGLADRIVRPYPESGRRPEPPREEPSGTVAPETGTPAARGGGGNPLEASVPAPEAGGPVRATPGGPTLLPPSPDPQFSIRTIPEWRAKARAFLEKAGLSKEEISRHFRGIDSQMRLLEALARKEDPELDRFPLGANRAEPFNVGKGLGKASGPWRKNADPIYKVTFDLTTKCLRSANAIATWNALAKKLGRPLAPEEGIAVTLAFRLKGETATCLYCYVDSPRRKQSDFLLRWKRALDGTDPAPAGYENVVKVLREKGVSGDDVHFEKYFDAENWDPSRERDVTFTAEFPKKVDNKVVGTESKTMSLSRLLDEQANAAKAKKIEAYEEYKGQALDLSQELIDYLNSKAGVRFLSNSDLAPEHIVDFMQAVHDLALRRARAHAYTKEPLMARLFGRTGMKIQTSIFARTLPDGRVVEDATMGMPWQDAQEARAASRDVGPVLVATDDAQVAHALDSSWIDYIIPYHASQFPKKYSQPMGWRDYSHFQHESWRVWKTEAAVPATLREYVKAGKGGFRVDPEKLPAELRQYVSDKGKPAIRSFHYLDMETGTTNSVARRRYLEICDSIGVKPVFEDIRLPNGKRVTSHKNYIRLKKDFARTDTPFRFLEPKFDLEAAGKATSDYARDGSKVGLADQGIVDELAQRFAAGDRQVAHETVLEKLAQEGLAKGDELEKAKTAPAEEEAPLEEAGAEAGEEEPQFSRRPLREVVEDPADVRDLSSRPTSPDAATLDESIVYDPPERKDGFLSPFERFYQRTVRSHTSLEKFDRTADARGRGQASAGEAAELARGSGVRAWSYIGGPGESLKTILEPLRGKTRDLSRYLIAKRAIELEGRPYPVKTGVDLQAARRFVDAAPPEIQQAAKRITALQNQVLDYWATSAGLPQHLVDLIRSMNSAYVPFYRVLDEGDAANLAPTELQEKIRSRAAALQAEQTVQRIEGGTQPLVDPLLTVIEHINRMVRAADVNRVGDTLVRVAEANPAAAQGIVQRAEIKRPTPTKASEAVQKLARDLHVTITDEEAAVVAKLSDKDIGLADGTIRVYREGRLETWKVDRDIADSLRALGPQQLGAVVKLFAFPARMLRSGVTKNPVFSLFSAIRDTFDASIQSTNGFRPIIDSVKGLRHSWQDTDLRRRYYAAGGGHVGVSGYGLKGADAQLREVLPKTLGQKAVLTVRHPLEALGKFGEHFEEATRLGEFERALQRGKSDEEAALDANRVTTNFSVHGSDPLVNSLAQMTAFLTPAIQGVDRFARSFTQGGSAAKAVGPILRAALLLGVPSAVLYALNRDDKEINELRRTTSGALYWFVRPKADGPVYRIPKPFLWGQLFGTGIEAGLDAWQKDDPTAFKRWAESVLDQAGPNTLMPTFLQVGLGLKYNEHPFFKTPIVPRGLEKLEPRYQSKPETSFAAQKLGEKTNVSPARIDYVANSLGGGLGTEAMKFADLLLDPHKVERPEPQLPDTPLVGRLFARTPSSSTYAQARFRDEEKRTGEAAATQKWLAKQGDREGLARLRSERLSELRAAPAYEKVRREMTRIATLMDQIKRSPKLSSEEKRARLDRLVEAQNRLAERGVAAGRLQ